MIDFNVNHYVYVKLRPIGRKELQRQHDELNKEIDGLLGEYEPPGEDKDGWSKWQLHTLMNKFGHMMTLGFDPPFETTIRVDT